MQGRRGPVGWITLVTIAALVLRLVLGFVIYPATGYAGDIEDLTRWTTTDAGPSSFYSTVRGANYPPVAIWALWSMRPLAPLVAPLLGMSTPDALIALLKLPAIIGDVLCVPVAATLALRMSGPRAAAVAAVLVGFVPVSWYTSAIWGQLDGMLAACALLALLLWSQRRPELAMLVAVAGMLVKPQGVLICLVVGVAIWVGRSGPTRLAGVMWPGW